MELNVQKYLRSGKTLEDLHNEFSIKLNESNGLVCLSYNQINSPKGHLIVRECRGLILEMNTWNVVSMAFHRFFNYGEFDEFDSCFNFDKAVVLEKVDGTLISLFNYCGDWMISTRGTVGATGPVGFYKMTFKNLFDHTVSSYDGFWDLVNSNYNYVFELVSPENKIVTPYNKRALYLLTVRNTADEHKECDHEEVEDIGGKLGVNLPATYKLSNIKEIKTYCGNLEKLDEGFVCIDYSTHDDTGMSFPRLKVKNPRYLAISRLKEHYGSSMRGLMEAIIIGEEDEILIYLPEYNKLIEKLKGEYERHLKTVEGDYTNAVEATGKSRDLDEIKRFALYIKDNPNKSIFFSIYNKKAKNAKDYYQQAIERKGSKNVAKNLVTTLGFDNEDFSWML